MSGEMKDPRPHYRTNADGTWEVRTANLGALRAAVGLDIFDAFVRCFIHADRLNSLVAFVHFSQTQLADSSKQRLRNEQTFHFSVVATLRELAKSITDLENTLRAADRFPAAAWASANLAEWDGNWAARVGLIDTRENVAAHVDLKVLRKGLELLESGLAEVKTGAGEGTILFEGDHPNLQQKTWFPLGVAALVNGRHADENFKRETEIVEERLNAYAVLVDVFFDVLQQVGLSPIEAIDGQPEA